MKKLFCFKSLFLFQLYSPLDISPSSFEVCSCVLNFIVIGHYTINIPENFQALTIFTV